MPYNFKRLLPPKRENNYLKGRTVRVGDSWLNARDARILDEYLKDFNGSAAARRAGVPERHCASVASQTLRKPEVMLAFHYELRARRERVAIDIDEVARYWYDMANGDVRELIPVRWAPCRYCYGIDFQYQYTMNELRLLKQAHHHKYKDAVDEPPMLDEKGGDGYDVTLEPNSDCPECNGEGEVKQRRIDFTTLSRGALLLLDGIRVSSDGKVELKVRDRTRAMENFQLVMGFVKSRKLVEEFNLDSLTDDQMNSIIQSGLDKGLLTPADMVDVTPVSQI